MAISIFVGAALAAAQPSPTFDEADAVRIFGEFARLCEAENGVTWGMTLCGKMMLVDRDSHAAYYNAPPPVAAERIGEKLWAGHYPDDLNVANTSKIWDDERWLQLIENPDDPVALRTLAMHEAFHGIQDALGFDGNEGFNDHLEEQRARYWLRLEAKALVAALADDRNWREPLADALRFNRQRAMLYPGSRANEAALVNHEGLAEYTGIIVGGAEEATRLAIAALETIETRPSLVRSLGYVVGPAYGLLLDRTGAEWKAQALAGAPLPLLLETALDDRTPEDAARGRYEEARIAAEEGEREKLRQLVLADLRQKFVEGPTLTLPFAKMNISFNPNRVTALDDLGSIRSGAMVTDLWGRLVVEGDVLLDKNWSFAVVPVTNAPSDNRIEGEEWTLELADGWTIVPGERDGDYTLKAPE